MTDGVVRIRRWRRDDLDDLVVACQDPDIVRWTSVPSPYTDATGMWFLDRCDEWWAAGSDLPLAIVDDATGALLGATGVHRIGAAPDAPDLGGLPDEVGYWLAAWARGRGFVTRGVQQLADWWFTTLDRRDDARRRRPDRLRRGVPARPRRDARRTRQLTRGRLGPRRVCWGIAA